MTVCNTRTCSNAFARILLVIFLISPFYAQAQDTASLSKKLDALIAQRLMDVAPGAVVLVVQHGKTTYEKAFGLADIAKKEPMQTGTTFRLGSMSKQFTAIAIMQLIEQGKLSLQDSVQKFVKDYPVKERPITIEHLLTMTSGIKNYLEINNPAKEREHYTPQQGVDYFKDEPLKFAPGTQFDYSNSNYYLLGYIIEQVTHTSFRDYLTENVLQRADLANTYYMTDSRPHAVVASGYERVKGEFKDAALQSVEEMYSAGGLLGNAEDLYKWHQALFAGKLVSPAMLQKAFSPYLLQNGSHSAYGYGWFLKNIYDAEAIEHSGSTDGYQTDQIYIPALDLFVVTLFNGFHEDMYWMMLADDVAGVAMGKNVDSALTIGRDQLKQYPGEYVYNAEHQLIVTEQKGQLFVMCTNPKDRLPKVQMFAENDHLFYIKEAPLRFDFVKDSSTSKLKIITYNSFGKDAEWLKKE